MSRNPNSGIFNAWPKFPKFSCCFKHVFSVLFLWITNRDNSDWEVETCWWGWVVDRCWSDWPPGGCYLGGPSLSPYSPSCHVFLDWSSITRHTFSCWSTSMGNTPVNQTLLINFILWKCCFYHSENVQRKIMPTLWNANLIKLFIFLTQPTSLL